MLKDWRWIAGVSLLMASPLYLCVRPAGHAVLAHGIGTLMYAGLLLMFGRGSVVETALLMVFLAMGVGGGYLGWGAIQKKKQAEETKGKP